MVAFAEGSARLEMKHDTPLLTIAIPTWNRARFLAYSLEQLVQEADGCPELEVLISDNASSDDTVDVVRRAIERGLRVRYVRNEVNIGSDRNIAQCFNLALGRYVYILGDDDVLVDGMLAKILAKLKESSPSVILLRAYGFDRDFRAESPGVQGGWVSYSTVEAFLLRAGAQITLISACIILKERISSLDANQFVGCSLVQVHLVLRALLEAKNALSYEGYAVACKRNNSGGYLYARVFVQNLGEILDAYRSEQLSSRVILRFENNLLQTHHPYYVWRRVYAESDELRESRSIFDQRFMGRWHYRLFVLPMFMLPKPLAWVWGLFSVLIGRAFFGNDLRRGFYFLVHWVQDFIKRAMFRASPP